MKILVINAGSSSLKYQLFDMDGEKVLAKGLCERIGIGGHLKHKPLIGDKPVFDQDIDLPTHAEAIAACQRAAGTPVSSALNATSRARACGSVACGSRGVAGWPCS